MRYFVIGPNGQKYGPADVPTLNQWSVEGRLFPQTMLEAEGSGAQVFASSVAGIQFPVGTPPPSAVPAHHYAPTYAEPYTPPQYAEEGSGPAWAGIGLGVASIALSFLLGWGSLLCLLGGFGTSWSARKERPTLAYVGILVNVIALAVFVFQIVQEQRAIWSATQ